MILSELRAQGWKYGCIVSLFALLAATGTAGVQTYRVAVAKGATAILARDWAQATATAAEAMTRASEAARAEEQSRAAAVNAAADAYERGKRNAQATADRTAADLRAGNVRLRAEIRALAARGVPGDPAAAGEPSGAAERGAELAGAAVGVGAKCDARVTALVQAYEAVRGQHASRPGD